MARFFFHLHECGVVIPDEEGVDMHDFESAALQAVCEARSIMAADVRDGALCLACHIEIEDRGSGSRRVMTFREALSVTG